MSPVRGHVSGATQGLVLYNPVAKDTKAPDYPWAWPLEELNLDGLIAGWGTVETVSEWARVMAPSFAGDPDSFGNRYAISGSVQPRRRSDDQTDGG